MENMILRVAMLAIPILIAVTVHEVAHGYAALKFGDRTAQMSGRLSLNPIKHLDPVGTLVFIITQRVGWAKPVPVNPNNFQNPRQDMMWVSLAGPASNLAMAGILGLGFQALLSSAGHTAGPALHTVATILMEGVMINVGLAVFNLLPVPPLDGSGILSGLLPEDLARQYDSLTPYGFIILLVLIFTGLVGKIIVPIIITIGKFFLGVP
jgi:Zn-dependent protease